MSPFVKSTYLSIFTTAVVFLAYAFWVFQVVGVGYFSGPDELVRIGKAIGVLIIGGWAFHILVVLGVTVFDLKKSGRGFSELLVDERDRQITYRSMYISMHVLIGGILLAVAALAGGWSAFWVFNIIVLGYALANVTELGAKMFFIHRGISG